MNGKIFLHICCAPCLCYSADFLRQNGFDVTGFWYNPNIHPLKEYGLRRRALAGYQGETGLDVIEDGGYEVAEWFERMRPGWSTGKKEDRCSLCYEIRLGRTAAQAAKRGYGKFSTTLLYSRYQFHERIVEIGRRLADANGMEFVYFDFRRGWRKGIEISKAMGLYRQRYCGCLFSELEAGGGGVNRRTGTNGPIRKVEKS